MALARAAARSSRRGAVAAAMQQARIATYAIRPSKDAAASLGCQDDAGAVPSQRESTASVARRLQWQTLPLHAPRTLAAVVQEPCSQARIVTEAHWPHRVVFCNEAWQDLCGWRADEVVGKHGLSFIQGELTDPLAVQRINAAVAAGERLDVKLVNYTREGTPFVNHLQITPLATGLGEWTHVLGILERCDDMGQCQLRSPVQAAAA